MPQLNVRSKGQVVFVFQSCSLTHSEPGALCVQRWFSLHRWWRRSGRQPCCHWPSGPGWGHELRPCERMSAVVRKTPPCHSKTRIIDQCMSVWQASQLTDKMSHFEPGQCCSRVPSSWVTHKGGPGPWAKGRVFRWRVEPYLLRWICCEQNEHICTN